MAWPSLLLCILGVSAIAVALVRAFDSSRDITRREVIATRALIDTGSSLTGSIHRVLDPAMHAARTMATDAAVVHATESADSVLAQQACNELFRAAPAIDAIALFDGSGRILAMNSIYRDGSPIPAERLDRVLHCDFSEREIVMGCIANGTTAELLEFQTNCDITPALFDSSGLSVAYSVPILSPADSHQIGVVSVRLRSERLTALLHDPECDLNGGVAFFVTDRGAIFDEQINAGVAPLPMAQDELAAIVAPLAAAGGLHSIVERPGKYFGLFRMDEFHTIGRGGIQLMVLLPQQWIAAHARLDRFWDAGVPAAIGPLLIAAGGILWLLASLAETRRLQAQSGEQLRSVFASLAEGIVVQNLKGEVIDCNSASETILGLTADQLTGRTSIDPRWHSVREDGSDFPGDEHPAMVTLRTGRSIRDQVMGVRTPQGEQRWISISSEPVRSSSGATTSVVTSFTDVTANKLAEEALAAAQADAEAASAAKSEFLANMSHEIRTPMTAILGFTELLAADGDREHSPRQRLQYIDTIRRNGEHLISIINDILDISKIEAGKMTVECTQTQPIRLAHEVISLMDLKAADKELELRIRFSSSVPDFIQSDPVRLRQILVNLVGNAIKFTMQGSITLDVSCDPANRLMRFDVIDTGIGLTADQLNRLFGAFVQADSTTTRRFGGSGLGLRISKRLSRMLGGDIMVRSTPGQGSKFSVTIATGDISAARLVPPEEAQSVVYEVPQVLPAAAARPLLTGVRILLAEDGPDNQRLISFHLRKAGAEVVAVENGKLAVETLSENAGIDAPLIAPPPFDLLLTDIQMPEMDGYAATRLLRAKGCKLPIVALTANAMSGDRDKCLECGCDSYASKPIDRNGLIQACRDALSMRRAPSRAA